MSSLLPFLRKNWPALLIGLFVVGWIFWLRAPSWPVKIWNVDETIHASVADILLDGGVIYRDAIDQRTPLTYYVVAAIFAVTGIDLPAVRIVITGMIALTALLLGLTVRRQHGGLTAMLAMIGFGATTSYLLFEGDMFSANTEWFVVLFTTAAAAVFWTGRDAALSIRRCVGIGVLLSLAVLSKQSALLELGAPLVTLAVLGLTGTQSLAKTARQGLALLAGFAAPLLLTGALLAAAGAWDDFWLYAWTYNVKYYGPEIPFAEKLTSMSPWILRLWTHYPVFLIAGLAAGLVLLWRVLQWQPSDAMRRARPVEVYLLTWCAMSLGSALSGGRGYDHYLIVCLAPFAWIAALAATGFARALARALRLPRAIPTAVLAAVFALPALWVSREARNFSALPEDPAVRIVDIVQANAPAEAPIFVWGYNPDIYTLAERRPASRFIYCSFQTGLIPWTNIGPGIDTSYAILPNAMDDLMADLEQSKPPVFIDASLLTHRGFSKYPLSKFPRLQDWVKAHYVEIEASQYNPIGFRLYLRREEAPALDPSQRTAIDRTGNATVHFPQNLSPGSRRFGLSSWGSAEQPVTGLALTAGNELIAAVPLNTTAAVHLTIPYEIEAANDGVELTPWVRLGAGPWQPGASQALQVSTTDVTPEQADLFAIPIVSAAEPAHGVLALLGARAETIDGTRRFAMHAPSLLRYQIPAEAERLRGFYTLPPAAYAADNPAPSDGAEFIVRTLLPDGSTQVLLQQLLLPTTDAYEQRPRFMNLALPAADGPRILELEINPGPAGIPSSDWTQWVDLAFITSDGR